MGMRLSLLATAATAAVFLSTGTVAGAASDRDTSGTTEAKAPVVLADKLVGPLHVTAGRHGSVTVSESFGGRLTRVDSKGTRHVLYETPDWSVAGNARQDGETYFLESKGAGPNPAA
ncbi:MAG TPA: ScyD/ScyE family protein, partial [Arthrobacter sp.]